MKLLKVLFLNYCFFKYYEGISLPVSFFNNPLYLVDIVLYECVCPEGTEVVVCVEGGHAGQLTPPHAAQLHAHTLHSTHTTPDKHTLTLNQQALIGIILIQILKYFVEQWFFTILTKFNIFDSLLKYEVVELIKAFETSFTFLSL